MPASPSSRSLRQRRGLLALCLGGLCLPGAQALELGRLWPSTQGSGPVLSEVHQVPNFHKLKLSCDAKVVLKQGEREAVELQAEANIAPLIDVYVEGNTLVVKDRRSYRSPNALVTVTVRQLEQVASSGSVAISAEGLRLPNLQLSLGGSSSMRLSDVALGLLSAELGGSSVLKLAGTAEDLRATLGGSAVLQASELRAQAVSVNSGGSSLALVWPQRSLQGSLGGSSGLSYYGEVSPSVASGGSASLRRLGSAPH